MKYYFFLFFNLSIFNLGAFDPNEEASRALAFQLQGQEDAGSAAAGSSFGREEDSSISSFDMGSLANGLGLTEEELNDALQAEFDRGEFLRSSLEASGRSAVAAEQESDEAYARRLQEEGEVQRDRQEREEAATRAFLEQEQKHAEQEGRSLAFVRELQNQQDQEDQEELDRQERKSIALALQLQEQERRGGAAAVGWSFHPINGGGAQKAFEEGLVRLHEAYHVQLEKATHSNGEISMDVHVYNRTFKPHLLAYLELDEQKGLKTITTHPCQEIQAKILEYISSSEERKSSYGKAPAFIASHAKKYLESGVVDPEVGKTYAELLSRCWDLCLRIQLAGLTIPVTFSGRSYEVSAHLLDLLAYAHQSP